MHVCLFGSADSFELRFALMCCNFSTMTFLGKSFMLLPVCFSFYVCVCVFGIAAKETLNIMQVLLLGFLPPAQLSCAFRLQAVHTHKYIYIYA